MKLSILTPACWERMHSVRNLRDEIQSQIIQCPPFSVEHLVLLDNRTRSVGLKRQALVDAAIGDYIAFVDDDDWVTGSYVPALLEAIESGADVITFKQDAIVNGGRSEVIMKLRQPDEPWVPGGTVLRDAWHVCAWRREIARQCVFPDLMDGEDLAWSKQARKLARSTVHLDSVLHVYRHDSEKTLASGKTAPSGG